MRKIKLNLPKHYLPLWEELLQLAQSILIYPENHENPFLWPVLGLGKKASNTVQSCAVLASLDLWSDFLVVGRSLFETEIIITWLLQENTEERIKKFLNGIEQERNTLASKAKTGTSSFGQILSDIFGHELIRSKVDLDVSVRNWSGMNVREMARDVDTENNYETLYWLASAFVHSHALSVIDTNHIIRKNLRLMGDIFSLDSEGMTRKTALISLGGSALNVFILLNNVFGIGIDDKISRAKVAQKYAYSETFGYNIKFSNDLNPGELLIYEETTGQTKLYSPKKIPKRSTSKKHKRR